MVEPQIGVSLSKKLCCGWVVVFFLKKWSFGVLFKDWLMLLLGCVIKSHCGCVCGHSSQIDCVVVLVVIVKISFCSSLNCTGLIIEFWS